MVNDSLISEEVELLHNMVLDSYNNSSLKFEIMAKQLYVASQRVLLIGNAGRLAKYKDKAQIVDNRDDPYSLRGLKSVGGEVNGCDVFFTPNFLIPFSVKIPVISVMHDLIFLDMKETTRGAADRAAKKFLLKRCMKKSGAVACVSRFTLERCERYYKKYARKCFLNYNGVGKNVLEADVSGESKQKGALVFVGNVKPHKGLKTLVDGVGTHDDSARLRLSKDAGESDDRNLL